MSVHLEHAGRGVVRAAIVGGLDTLPALRHLCLELESGGGLSEPIVVIDLTAAPVVAQAAEADLDRTARELQRTHRWLGVVEPQHAAAAPSDGWYVSTGAAVKAGRTYLNWVLGRPQLKGHVETAITGLFGVLSWIPAVATGGYQRGRDLMARMDMRSRK